MTILSQSYGLNPNQSSNNDLISPSGPGGVRETLNLEPIAVGVAQETVEDVVRLRNNCYRFNLNQKIRVGQAVDADPGGSGG